MQSELVIATYQKPAYLVLVLATLAGQRRLPDSVCIADDGSDARTEAVIARFRTTMPNLSVRHLWQEDVGFRKTQILNEAVRTSTADYMIFLDDDCLMHPGFIERHLTSAEKGKFLSSSPIRLGDQISKRILEQGQVNWTEAGRLEGWSPGRISDWLKSMPFPRPVMGWLERLVSVRPHWSGGSASTHRANIVAANGFDTSMGYGGEDKEFGVRLQNAGIKGYRLRYTAPLYHLEHGRGYVDPEVQRANLTLIRSARTSGKVRTERGIDT